MRIERVEGGKAPQRMTGGAVGFDVFARKVDLVSELVPPDGGGEPPASAKIHLGFKIDCNAPHFGVGSKWKVDERSGINKRYTDGNTYELNFAAMLLPRSGWGRDYGFRLKNTAGIIDPDYRGEVIMEAVFDECPPDLATFYGSHCNGCAINKQTKDCDACVLSNSLFGQPRVGQMILVPAYVGDLQVVDKLDDTERGAGGFGSTGS